MLMRSLFFTRAAIRGIGGKSTMYVIYARKPISGPRTIPKS